MDTINTDNLVYNWKNEDLFINHDSLTQAINSIKTAVNANTINLTPNKIVISSQPLRQPEVIIQAEHIIDYRIFQDEDQTAVDKYIKTELARKIAKQLVDEDLIQIQVNDDPATLDKKVRAKIKIIQE